MLRQIEHWDKEAIAASDFGVFWGSSVNIHPMAIWGIIEIFRDQALLSRVRKELEAISFGAMDNDDDVERLLAIPLLRSIYSELLRLFSASGLTDSYMPFGIGKRTCPGRGWAQREIVMFCALITDRLVSPATRMETLTARLLFTTITVLATLLAYCSIRLYAARSLIWQRQSKGLPVAPGHSFLFGHLLFFKKALDKLPPNAHYQNALGDIARQYFLHEGCYYIDMWPVSGILFVIVSPHMANQIHANPNMSMQRPELLPRFFKPIAGGPNMFDMREHEWKPWRSIFSKAFSAENIVSLVPHIVEETLVYRDTLRGLAKQGAMFHLDLITLRFTIDVIGKTILNAQLQAQKGYNTLADCMLSQIRWHQANADTNPLEYLNLVRKAIHWWNGRQMDRYIDAELSKRYAESRADPNDKRSKAIIDLVLQSHLSQQSPDQISDDHLDSGFRTFAIRQIRLFVFAGHDSTSSTLCYIFHLLSTHPSALSKLRDEHDTLLDSDRHGAPSLLASDPYIINTLHYTTAVIKESLRLFPPGGCSRSGQLTVSLTSDSGKQCPTSDVAAVFTIHSELHRSPVYWKRPDEFLPERWLAKPGDELYPIKGAYRAFEIGPRNCVAQLLVMNEMKVIVACLAREFDFQPAYEEFDRGKGGKVGGGVRTYRGERAYQVEEGAAHPADHYPCRVTVRKG
ncbi:MAG: hypothetical protein Q9219_007065 [cf. Caloplaca sp. 3 TL-2023]